MSISFQLTTSQLSALPKDILVHLLPYIVQTESTHDLDWWIERVRTWFDDQLPLTAHRCRTDELRDYVYQSEFANRGSIWHCRDAQPCSFDFVVFITFCKDELVMPFGVYHALCHISDSQSAYHKYKWTLDRRRDIQAIRVKRLLNNCY
jgi:hypothetical protein